MTRAARANAPSTIANRLSVAAVDDAAAVPGAAAGTSTIVLPSADAPAGIGSAPIVGRRHAPGTDWLAPPNPGWTTSARTRVEAPSGVATMSRLQVASGTPTGRS